MEKDVQDNEESSVLEDTYQANNVGSIEDTPLTKTQLQAIPIEDRLQDYNVEKNGTVESNDLLYPEESEVLQDLSAVSGKETRTVVIIAVAYLFVFISYMAIQNLQSSLNDEDGLGVISLSVLYAGVTISGVLAPMLISRFGVKPVIVTAFLAFFIYSACNFYPAFATLIPSSFLLGLFGAPLWTSQGIFITICAYSWACRTGGKVQKQLGLYNGIFWCIFDLSSIVGNLVSSLVLHQGSYNLTETNFSSFCGAIDCPRAETEDTIADPQPAIVYTILGIFLGCVMTGIVITACCLPSVQSRDTSKTPLKTLVKSWFRFIPSTDMKLLVPFSFYTGIGEQVLAAEITKSYISCPLGIQNVGYVLTAYGIARSLSGILSGRLAKYINRYTQVSFACTILVALHVWMLLWAPDSKSTIYIYVLCSLFGVALGINAVQFLSALGEMFVHQLSIVFAVNFSIKALGYTVTFVYSSFLCTRVKFSIAIGCNILALVLYLHAEFRYARRKKNSELAEKIVPSS